MTQSPIHPLKKMDSRGLLIKLQHLHHHETSQGIPGLSQKRDQCWERSVMSGCWVRTCRCWKVWEMENVVAGCWTIYGKRSSGGSCTSGQQSYPGRWAHSWDMQHESSWPWVEKRAWVESICGFSETFPPLSSVSLSLSWPQYLNRLYHDSDSCHYVPTSNLWSLNPLYPTHEYPPSSKITTAFIWPYPLMTIPGRYLILLMIHNPLLSLVMIYCVMSIPSMRRMQTSMWGQRISWLLPSRLSLHWQHNSTWLIRSSSQLKTLSQGA